MTWANKCVTMEHGTNTNRNNISENSYMGLAINKKNKNISRYHTTNLLKTCFLFLVCKKGQKQDKRELTT